MERYLGIDIGGTKTAVVLGSVEGDRISINEKRRFPTEKTGWEPNVEKILD